MISARSSASPPAPRRPSRTCRPDAAAAPGVSPDGAAFDEGSRIRPDVAREVAEFGTRQQIALQSVDAIGKGRIAAEPVDERQQHAIELAAERMLRIVAHFLEERGRGRHDLVHQKLVGAIELQQRRQFAADLLADHGHGFGLRQRLMHHAQDVVEQALMPSLLHEARAACRRRAAPDRSPCSCVVMRRLMNVIRPGGLRRRHRFRQQPQRKAREIVAALAVAQPVGDERAEIDLAQLGFDGCGFEEMHLDEFAELVGDAVLVALDDRGVRDRQSQRPA